MPPHLASFAKVNGEKTARKRRKAADFVLAAEEAGRTRGPPVTADGRVEGAELEREMKALEK